MEMQSMNYFEVRCDCGFGEIIDSKKLIEMVNWKHSKRLTCTHCGANSDFFRMIPVKINENGSSTDIGLISRWGNIYDGKSEVKRFDFK